MYNQRVTQFLNTYLGLDGYALSAFPYSVENLQVNPVIGSEFIVRSSPVPTPLTPTPTTSIPIFSYEPSHHDQYKAYQQNFQYENFSALLCDYAIECASPNLSVSNLNGCGVVVAKLSKNVGMNYLKTLLLLIYSYFD